MLGRDGDVFFRRNKVKCGSNEEMVDSMVSMSTVLLDWMTADGR